MFGHQNNIRLLPVEIFKTGTRLSVLMVCFAVGALPVIANESGTAVLYGDGVNWSRTQYTPSYSRPSYSRSYPSYTPPVNLGSQYSSQAYSINSNAMTFDSAGDFERAISEFERALQLDEQALQQDPYNATFQKNVRIERANVSAERGKLYEEKSRQAASTGNWEAALTYLQQALTFFREASNTCNDLPVFGELFANVQARIAPLQQQLAEQRKQIAAEKKFTSEKEEINSLLPPTNAKDETGLPAKPSEDVRQAKSAILNQMGVLSMSSTSNSYATGSGLAGRQLLSTDYHSGSAAGTSSDRLASVYAGLVFDDKRGVADKGGVAIGTITGLPQIHQVSPDLAEHPTVKALQAQARALVDQYQSLGDELRKIRDAKEHGFGQKADNDMKEFQTKEKLDKVERSLQYANYKLRQCDLEFAGWHKPKDLQKDTATGEGANSTRPSGGQP